MEDVRVKICGLTSETAIAAVAEAGASYVGFVFFSKSPRNLGLERAARLAAAVPSGLLRVAVTVDASDSLLKGIRTTVPIDILQLQGTESPARVARIRDTFGVPVIKAVGIEDESDLDSLAGYGEVADQLLVDAKPPRGIDLPGGNGLRFDWRLLSGRHLPVPWMLAGGLTPENVAEAIHLAGARQVDVSSGVERSPGIKDIQLVRSFVSAAQSAS